MTQKWIYKRWIWTLQMLALNANCDAGNASTECNGNIGNIDIDANGDIGDVDTECK